MDFVFPVFHEHSIYAPRFLFFFKWESWGTILTPRSWSAGIAIDGVPESMMIGFMAADGQMSISFIVSVFLANFPEAQLWAQV